jgi:hypothetical protein
MSRQLLQLISVLHAHMHASLISNRISNSVLGVVIALRLVWLCCVVIVM